jgi:hypothetical protein
MNGISHALRRARFEALERRDLLAGDVLVSVVDGSLVVEGDELGNVVSITAGAAEGEFVVSGLDGTTVHQEGDPPAAEVTVTGVTGGLRADLGEGDDELTLVDAGFAGNVSIGMGDGNDTVNIGAEAVGLAQVLPLDASVRVHGLLNIRTGDGDDEVNIDDAAIRGSLNIGTGMGEDLVSLGGELAPAPATSVLGGVLNDDTTAASLHVRGSLHVNLGEGNDDVDATNVAVRGFANINAGEGDDGVDLAASHFGSLSVLTDGGLDNVALGNVHARFAFISTGEDNDQVSIVDSVFHSLGVFLGDGDDTLSLDTVQARFAGLFAGAGEDTLEQLGENDLVHAVIRGFEIPPDVNMPLFPGINGLLNRLRLR